MPVRWWCVYEDGCVWPVELAADCVWPGAVVVRSLPPAPDAGEERVVERTHVYSSDLERLPAVGSVFA